MSPQGDGRPIPARHNRPTSARGRKREEEIVAAAARIFNEKGYAATSIRDIADAVGLLKGSLYYYVPSKEDLLYKIIVEVHAGAMANLRRAEEFEGSVVDRLRTFVRGHVLQFAQDIVMIRVFYVDFMYLSADRHAEILGERDRYEHFLTDLIAAGQADGSFAPDVDARVAAIAILTMLNSVYMWYRPDGPLSMGAIGEQFETLVLRSLLPRPITGTAPAPAADRPRRRAPPPTTATTATNRSGAKKPSGTKKAAPRPRPSR